MAKSCEQSELIIQGKGGFKLLVTTICWLCCFNVDNATYAQDHEFHNYQNARLVLNPASTGMMESSFRIQSQVQVSNQNFFFSRASNLYYLSVDAKAYLSETTFLGFGTYMVSNLSNRFTTGQDRYNFTSSFTKVIEKDTSTYHYIGGGVNVGLSNKLVFYDMEGLPGFSSTININTINVGKLDLGFGLLWQYFQANNRVLELGFSVEHLISPNMEFAFSPDIDIPLRYTLHGRTLLFLNERFNLAPRINFFLQGNDHILFSGTSLQWKYSKYQPFNYLEAGGQIGFDGNANVYNSFLTYKIGSFVFGMTFTFYPSGISENLRNNTCEFSVSCLLGEVY